MTKDTSQQADIEEFAANATQDETDPPPSPSHHLAEMRRDPDAIRELFLTGKYPYHTKLSTRDYEKKKKALQVELLKVQRWVKETGEKNG